MNEKTILFRLKAIGDFQDVVSNVQTIQKGLNSLKLPSDLNGKFTDIFSDFEKEAKKYQKYLDSGLKTKADFSGFEKSGNAISRLLKQIKTEMSSIDSKTLSSLFQVDTDKIEQANNKLKELRAQLATKMEDSSLSDLKSQAKQVADELSNLSKSKFVKEFQEAFAAGDIDRASIAIENLVKNHKKLKNETDENSFQHWASKAKEALDGLRNNNGISNLNADIRELQTRISTMTEDQFREFLEGFKNGADSIDDMAKSHNNLQRETIESAQAQKEMNDEVDQLKRQIVNFFGLTNAVHLFRRAVTSALNTVKELDATMTEAAVVTDFSVGDMWEKLPEYSKNAQALGVSVNGMYQATTLYYQQGLKSNEAMQLGVETMKMGKIAAMDSTEATKAMTAALRGFNMELNETSATRVNDVYSQLAAVTAADTSQIATAMEKTASIAASANMEFETTAALLAQIIETTQEAPETAGTAMKTIIARFAEVKSLRDQGLITGEDEEGEIIDVNKIQTALRSVGISMEGFFAGTEGLDSVLLKLSEKWSSLDFETQRYIATMAAGSRQQSRFIAMMSDYKRTTELVSQAQNSAGASQKQFQKTQESLETSLTRLENAWNQFLMGLTNNEALKAGVDGLTSILETINKTTEAISGGNGLVKSVMSLVGVLGALSAGKNLLGGTAVGGVIGGFLSKFANSNPRMRNLFSVPQGFDPKETKGVGKAKRAEVRASLKEKTSQLFKKPEKVEQIRTVNKEKLKGFMDNSDLSLDDQKKVNALTEAFERGEISVENYTKNLKKLKVESEGLITVTEKTTFDFTSLSKTLGVAGVAMIGVGTATSLLASAFESWGMEEEAEALQKFSGVLMGFGTVLSIISSILPVLTGLTWGQVAATWALLWPIALVVAALGGLIALIVVLMKQAHDKSLEGRMEAAAKATERAKEEAEAANEAYNELLSAKDGYTELQAQLDELTKGTLEWRRALAESNAEVLKLLETYPELAQYLTRGQHGELEINEAGWEYMEESSSKALANAQTAALSAQLTETQLNREGLLNKFEEDLLSIGYHASAESIWSDSTDYATDELIKRLYWAYQDNPNALKGLQEHILGNLGYSEEDIEYADYLNIPELISAIADLTSELEQNDVTIQAQTEALLQSQASKETYEYEFGKELITGFATGYAKNGAKKEQEIVDQLYTTQDNEFFDSLVSEYNVAASKITGDRLSDLRQLYAKMKNISVDEIDEDLSADQLAREIASIKATSDTAKKMDEVAQTVSKLDPNTQRAYSVMLSGDISGATQDFQAVTLEAMAKNLGLTGGADELKELFGIEDDTFINIEKLVEKAFAKIQGRANNFGINTYQEEFGSATVGQLGAYTDMMLYSTTSEGTTAKLQDGFDKILARANDTWIQQILSAMSTYDFTKEGAGESFVQDLRDIGIVLDETDQTIKDFIEQMDMVNAIFRDFDLSDVYDEVKRGLEEAEEVAESDYLSFEQYEKYAKEGLIDTADWTWNGKGWVNIENGMTELVQALKDNTLSNYNLTKQEAKEQKKWYQDKAKEFDNLQGTYYYDEQGGIYNAPKGVKKAKAVEDLGAYLAQEGLAETIWSQFFATFKEYEQWGKLYKGGFADLEVFLAGTETFDPTKVVLDAEKAWENPYDKFYNTIEKINAELREREKLERAYQRLLKDEASTVQQVLNNSKDQLKNLGAQKGLQQYLMEGKQAEINDLVASSNLKQYATFEDGMIKINWKEIEAVTNEKQGEEIEDYISKLEELRDQYQDAEDALLDIEDQIDEVIDQGKQEYLDLENQIKEAIIDARQEEIDKLSAINETIANSNSKILDSIRQSIEYQRQMRDNQKTEKELAKKQERLAYLKQSSSGAYDLEIMTLEEELAQDQQTYTDSLTDQRLAELEKQNEEARQQRQNQIDILQEQLAYEEANGLLWKEVKDIWEKGIDETGLVPGSKMEGLLKNSSDWKAMSAQQKVDWVDELNENIKAALSWEKLQMALANDDENLKTMINEAADKATASLDDRTNKVIDKIGQVEEKIEEVLSPKETQTYTTKSIGRLVTGEGSTREEAMADAKKQIKEDYEAELARIEKLYKDDPKKLATAKFELRQKYFSLTQFKTGGLADFTGPAWLDGTKSRPEYILNADQTKAFFKLIDVLGSFNDLGKTSQNSEENVYDIDINVENIDSDYDVDRIAERVKELVLASARYRNNNIL